jgi:hypothetical protein
MDSLKSRVGTLVFAEVQKFIRQSLKSSLNQFLSEQSSKSKVSDLPKKVDAFVEKHSPVPVKAATKHTNSKAAWQGFAKEFRLKNPNSKSKAVGLAWNKGKGIKPDEWDRLVILGNRPKDEKKARAKSTGNAWNGFRADFKAKNAKKNDSDETKLEDGQLTTAASEAWKLAKPKLTDSLISKYQKLANKIKDQKVKDLSKKKEAKKKRETKKAIKEANDAAEAKKKAAEAESGDESGAENSGDESAGEDSGSDSEDDKPLSKADESGDESE